MAHAGRGLLRPAAGTTAVVIVAVALPTGVLGFGIGASLGADDRDARLEVVYLRAAAEQTG